jgi:hypothetical protein
MQKEAIKSDVTIATYFFFIIARAKAAQNTNMKPPSNAMPAAGPGMPKYSVKNLIGRYVFSRALAKANRTIIVRSYASKYKFRSVIFFIIV